MLLGRDAPQQAQTTQQLSSQNTLVLPEQTNSTGSWTLLNECNRQAGRTRAWTFCAIGPHAVASFGHQCPRHDEVVAAP